MNKNFNIFRDFFSNTALVYKKHSITYEQLENMSNFMASKINSIYYEESIGILMNPSIETVISIIAILKSGANFVPMLPSFPIERIKYIINDTKLTKIIINNSGDDNDNHESNIKNDLLMANSDIQFINCSHVDFSNDELKNNDFKISTDLSENLLAYIMYTSGSTGNPKGVMVEHKSLLNICQHMQQIYKIKNKTYCKSILFSSYIWDVSLSEIFANLFNGNTIYILDDKLKLNIPQLYDYIQLNHIEICYFPPVLLSVLPLHEKCCIKKIIFAGEKCNNKYGLLWSKKVQLFNFYGPTECTIYVTGKKVNTDNVNEIGKPIRNTQIYIVDKNLSLVKHGEKGELLIGGVSLARGYLNMKEETNTFFIKNPFGSGKLYRTGDCVKLNKNNDLEYISRLNINQVNINGKRIEINEIVSTLTNIDFIKNVVVKPKINKTNNITEHLNCYFSINKHNDYHAEILNSMIKSKCDIWKNIFTTSNASSNTASNTTQIFDFGVWYSSGTNTLIPLVEMQDWLKNIIDSIHFPKKKNKILEIGIGSGLVMFSILNLNNMDEYYGCEPSKNTLDSVNHKINNFYPNFINKINLFNCFAHEIFEKLGNSKTHYFDIIIVNSVIQYFPHISYFENLMNQLNLLLNRENGVIFIGDILFDDLKKTNELQINPQYFLEKHQNIKIVSQKSNNNNEMTLHRYNINLFNNQHFNKNKIFKKIILKKNDVSEITDILSKKHENIKFMNICDSRKSPHDENNLQLKYGQIQKLLTNNNYFYNIEPNENNKINIFASTNKLNLHYFSKFSYFSNKTLFTNPLLPELNSFYSNKLRNHLLKNIPSYMIPKHFQLLEKFNLDSSGKINTSELNDIEINFKEAKKEDKIYDTKNILINDILSKLLNLKNIELDLTNNLLELGINSLQMIQIQMELHEQNYYIPNALFLKCQTINDLIQNMEYQHPNTDNQSKINILYDHYVNINNNDADKKYDYLNDENPNIHPLLSEYQQKYQVTYKQNKLSNTVIYRGACITSRYIKYLRYIQDGYNLVCDQIGNGVGQGHFINIALSSDIDSNILSQLEKDSCGEINKRTYMTNIETSTITIISLEELYTYKSYLHTPTNTLFVGSFQNFKKSSNFKDLGYISPEKMEQIVIKFLNQYRHKIIIFILCLEHENIRCPLELAKKYNEIIYKHQHHNQQDHNQDHQHQQQCGNVFIIDINKFNIKTKYVLPSNGGVVIPHKDQFKVACIINDLINYIYYHIYDTTYHQSKTFTKLDLINPHKNMKMHFINEKKELLTSVVQINNVTNIFGSGIIFILSNTFILNYVNINEFVSTISHKSSHIPIKKYIFQFYAKTDYIYDQFFFSIYTGLKYEKINIEVSDQYKLFKIESVFNFQTGSPIRITFINPHKNMKIYFYDICLIDGD